MTKNNSKSWRNIHPWVFVRFFCSFHRKEVPVIWMTYWNNFELNFHYCRNMRTSFYESSSNLLSWGGVQDILNNYSSKYFSIFFSMSLEKEHKYFYFQCFTTICTFIGCLQHTILCITFFHFNAFSTLQCQI